MADTKTASRTNTKATDSSAATAEKPRRITKRKQVEEHARSYFAAAAARDPAAMASHWSAEGVEDLVPVGVLRGPREVERFFGELFAAVPDCEMTVERVVADSSRAAVEWRMTGTFSGAPFQGIDPTGRRLELRGIDLLEVEDGEIKRNTVHYDGASFARQLGLLPPRDSGAERAMKSAFNAVTRIRKAVNERAR